MNRPPDWRFDGSVRSGDSWADSLPPLFRMAAELHFGTLILWAVIGAVRYGPGLGAGGLFVAALAWVQTHFRGKNRPGIWWFNTVAFTIMGVFFSLLVVFG